MNIETFFFIFCWFSLSVFILLWIFCCCCCCCSVFMYYYGWFWIEFVIINACKAFLLLLLSGFYHYHHYRYIYENDWKLRFFISLRFFLHTHTWFISFFFIISNEPGGNPIPWTWRKINWYLNMKISFLNIIFALKKKLKWCPCFKNIFFQKYSIKQKQNRQFD